MAEYHNPDASTLLQKYYLTRKNIPPEGHQTFEHWQLSTDWQPIPIHSGVYEKNKFVE